MVELGRIVALASFAIQAKKLHLTKERYTTLSHKVGKKLQIDLLEKYAAANDAIPAYCLYNHVTPVAAARGWNCCAGPVDAPQLACTVTPSSVVRTAIATWGAKRFLDIHGDPQTIPWRCLVKCKRLRVVSAASTSPPFVPESQTLVLDDGLACTRRCHQKSIRVAKPVVLNTSREIFTTRK